MGMFDFFKKIITGDKIKETEKIPFSDIRNWIINKEKENEIKEKEIFELITGRIKSLDYGIQEKIIALKNIDIEQKKVEDKIKFIVNEGREKYIKSIGNFIEKLNKLEKNNLEKFIEDTNLIFLSFNKNSHPSYERATILIGKEMANIKESLKSFSKNLINIFDENSKIMDFSRAISIIKLKLKQVNEIEENFKEINKTIISVNKRTKEQKEENKRILENIEEIKKTEDYLKKIEGREKIKLLKEDLEKDFVSLNQLINFKALANFYHIIEDKMEIVKAHRDDFWTKFQKDNGETILNLLNESNLNNEKISAKIKQINDKKEEIIKNEQKIKRDETEDLYSKSAKIILEIGNLNNEKTREEKRYEKLKANKEEIMGAIKEEIKKIGGEIEI